jgi:outer membrane protein TolC
MIRRCLPLVLAASAAAGCVTYEAKPLEPRAELKALREVADFVRARPGEGPAGTARGFDLRDGLSEEEAVSVGLTLHPGLRARREALGESRALLVTAGLWPNPVLEGDARKGVGGTPSPGLELGLLFELLRPGERAARKGAAEARVEETAAGIADAEWRLAAEVRSAWIAARAAGLRAALLEEESALRKRVADLVRERQGLGEATGLDVAAADLEAAERERDLLAARNERGEALRALVRALGLPPGFPLALEGDGEPLKVVVYDDPGDADLEDRVLAGRPDLRALEAAYRASEADLKLAVAGQYPRVGVGPSAAAGPGGDRAVGLGFSIEIPLFNRNQGEIAEKGAARERARAEYRAALHGALAEAFGARERAKGIRAEIEFQDREVIPRALRGRELAEAALRAGELGVLEWVAAQGRALGARQARLDAATRYAGAVVELEAAAGTRLSRPAAPRGGTRER